MAQEILGQAYYVKWFSCQNVESNREENLNLLQIENQAEPVNQILNKEENPHNGPSA